jgi:hypothetical protein
MLYYVNQIPFLSSTEMFIHYFGGNDFHIAILNRDVTLQFDDVELVKKGTYVVRKKADSQFQKLV